MDLSSLNDRQRKAVESKSKRTLVLAGAGSGKTKVLTVRMGYLCHLGVDPESILAVTFTNKAAKEMSERAATLLNDTSVSKHLWVGTFHSICNKILRKHYEKFQLPKNFQIIDGGEQKSLIKRTVEDLMKAQDIDMEKKELLDNAIDFINKAKEQGHRPEKAESYLKSLGMPKIVLAVYTRYEELRKLCGVLDFGDLILYVVELFEQHEDVLAYYNQRFTHVLVDEYQDTNKIQEKLIEFIANNNYLFVVGDDDQSIYGWRGAKIEYILSFKTRYDDCLVVKLEQNYRSTKNILDAANAVIKMNEKRHGKNLWTDGEAGSPLVCEAYSSPDEEAYRVTDQIATLIASGIGEDDIAILYRNNSISRAFEAKLTERRIPYKIIGGLSFWDREEVKDVLAYMDLSVNSNNDVSFERIINKPSRKIGKVTLQKIRDHAAKERASLFSTLAMMQEANMFKGNTAKAFDKFISIVNAMSREEFHHAPHLLVLKIVEDFDIYSAYEKLDEEKRLEKISNIQELAHFAKEYKSEDDTPSLDSMLQHARMQSEKNMEKDAKSVSMMTVHGSKGLEFPAVFVAGFEDGIFPSARSLNSKSALEEERRLAYVAITRAKEHLYLSSAGYRYNSSVLPSRFIADIPKALFARHQGQSGRSNSVGGGVQYSVGQKLEHPDFGYGEVKAIEQEHGRNVYVIDFGFIGIKRIKK
jgi:DNA helicase-2/ATP-dependent DNA helicase PcrA